MQELAPSDEELQLIDALQVWPRAPWSALAPILGSDPVTLTRRWTRLTERRLAWVTGQSWVGTGHGGYVEVECVGGALEDVVAVLSQDPECRTIDVTSGARDLLLTVGCRSAADFTRYVVGHVAGIPGVRAVRANPIVRSVATAEQWRTGALDAPRVRAVAAARDLAGARRAGSHAARLDPRVMALLRVDGRVSTRGVAEALDLPMRKARDLLGSTLASPALNLRTDMPRQASGWPVAAWYFVRVPAAHLGDVGARLRSLRAVRAIMSVAGPANLLINVWLRELGDVETLEGSLENQLPVLNVVDRSLVLAVRKRAGHLFDAEERSLGLVPWDGVEV